MATSSWLSARAVCGLLRRVVRDENPRLKTWQSRRGVPPRAAVRATKENAPAIYRRGRARRNFFDFFVCGETYRFSQAARTRLPTATCKRSASWTPTETLASKTASTRLPMSVASSLTDLILGGAKR